MSNLTVKQQARNKLMAYAMAMDPNYQCPKHVIAIAHCLEQVERGNIKRLMIFMPPRSGKTRLASELFPAWYLGRNPSNQVIATTYSFDRASDVGRKVRNQLIDPMFQHIFPECIPSADSKGANKLSTLADGQYYSVGVGGAITGRGAHLLLIDDPIKGREDAESELQRNKLIEWYQSVAYTRLMDHNAIILIMTRWHFNDLAGYLLDEQKHENWCVLNLAAIAEEDDDIIGRKEGEALWPEKFPVERLEETKRSIGTREWSALYQQRPVPEEGGMIQWDWFKDCRFDLKQFIQKVSEHQTKARRIVISWDTAYKETQLADPSAATVWVEMPNGFYLVDVVNKRMNFPKLKKSVTDLYAKYMAFNLGQVPVLIEDRASGQSLIQIMRQNTRMPVIAIMPENSKEARMSEVTALMEAGKVFLPFRAPWLTDLETQLIQFPEGRNDDMCDSVSQFLRWAGKPKYVKSKTGLFWK